MNDQARETEQRSLSGDNFTVTYEAANGRRVSVSVEREPIGWVMRSGSQVSLLGVRAPADLIIRACLQLEQRVMGSTDWQQPEPMPRA